MNCELRTCERPIWRIPLGGGRARTHVCRLISTTILDRVSNGSLLVLGKLGTVKSPHLVMPITEGPTKCYYERF